MLFRECFTHPQTIKTALGHSSEGGFYLYGILARIPRENTIKCNT